MQIASAYAPGYIKARQADPAMADRYIHYTQIGDPLADAALAACKAARRQDWISIGIEHGPSALADAPDAVRDFFVQAEQVPEWFDLAATSAGRRAFHGNSEMLIGSFVGAVLVEGFATLISKSFSITGRVMDQGVRRLKQNNRHLIEIFMPGGLERHGEGWKLSVRIRLMHARVRQMLNESPEWDRAAWGEPLSAAHIGFATAVFSGLLLARARQLGVQMTAEEAASFMLVWRYAGHLMGVPPELEAANEAEALRLHAVGGLCEPEPDMEAIQMANNLINSAPLVLGVSDPAERRKLARYIYRVSRALIGDRLADQLRYPPSTTFGVLPILRLRNRGDRMLRRLVPGWEQRRRAGQFGLMLTLSHAERGSIDYRLPARLHAETDGAQ